MRSWLLVAALLAAPVHAAPPTKPGPDGALDKCLAQSAGPASGIAHVLTCYRAADTRVEAALASTYRAQGAKLKAGGVSTATLVAGEAAWKTYRDKWCAFEAAAERDPGSHEATGLECRVELSQAHLARFKGAY
jgi:uncharacterized protein YecT (DUF1311 family)